MKHDLGGIYLKIIEATQFNKCALCKKKKKSEE